MKKIACPSCRHPIPFSQYFFKNRFNCPKCKTILTVSPLSRLIAFGPVPILICFGQATPQLLNPKLLIGSFAASVIYWLFFMKLKTVNNKNQR